VFKSSLANPKLEVTDNVTKSKFENGSNCSQPLHSTSQRKREKKHKKKKKKDKRSTDSKHRRKYIYPHSFLGPNANIDEIAAQYDFLNRFQPKMQS
jgi:hypothetical protein